MANYQLSKTGAQIDAALDLAVNAAQKNGSYDTLTSGKAKNLQGRPSDAVDAEFYHRTAGGSADIGSGGATIKSIHGKTLVWNQLVNLPNATGTVGGVPYTISNGQITFNGTCSASINISLQYIAIQSGHKYLLTNYPQQMPISALAYNTLQLYAQNIINAYITENDTVNGRIVTASGSGTAELRARIENGQTYSMKFYPQVFDLTQMFGAGNEPTTVAAFKALFPLPYYAYNAGALLNFNGTGLKTVGFQQWDEEVESGYIDSSGSLNPNATSLRSKNFCPCIPSKTYYVKQPTTYANTTAICWYDASKNFLTRGFAGNQTINSPANAAFFKVSLYGYGTTYKNDICINLSWSGYRNGDYEEYWESTLALPVSTYFATGMKSAGTAYDELTEKKAITRIGVVDLGTLTWDYSASATRFSATGIQYLAKKSASDYVVANVICEKYVAESVSDTAHYNGVGIDPRGYVYIKDTNYTDAATFKSAMSGVYLYYELATPTETDIDISLNYKVDDFGTEELLPENESTPTTSPFVASILYAMNAVDTIRNMPDKVYRAFVDIKDSNDVHHTFSVVVGAIPSIDTANTKLVGIPAGVYRAVKGYEHEYSDVEVDASGNVYIDGTLDTFAASDSTITTEKYF